MGVFHVCLFAQCSINDIQCTYYLSTKKINIASFLMTCNNVLSGLTLETLLATSLIFVNLSRSCGYTLHLILEISLI
jgi:hypothetical protein